MEDKNKTFSLSVALVHLRNILTMVTLSQDIVKNLFEIFFKDLRIKILITCDLKRVQKCNELFKIDWRQIQEVSPLLLSIQIFDETIEQDEDGWIGGMSINRANSNEYTTVGLSVKPFYTRTCDLLTIQNIYVTWAKQTFQEMQGIVGYITFDQGGAGANSPSQYEISIGLLYAHVADKLKEQVRGYYWGNFLNHNHVKLLGGESLLMNFPAFLIEELGSVGYYLQLTENIDNLKLYHLARLKKYVQPLLPKPINALPIDYERSWPYLLVHDDILHPQKVQTQTTTLKQDTSIRVPEGRRVEASNWLAQTTHPAALAANRFGKTQNGREFVQKLYELGAEEVLAELSPFGDLKEPHAMALIIKLPSDLEKRKPFFQIFTEELHREILLESTSIIEDEGQEELYLWWD